MKKVTFIVAVSFLLITAPALAQPDLIGTWCVYMSEAVSDQGQLCDNYDGSFSDSDPEEIEITDQDDYAYGTLFRGYVDHGFNEDGDHECGYFSGVLDGKTISITHWDSVTQGTLKQKGNKPPEIHFINNAFDADNRSSKTSIGVAVMESCP